MNEFSVVSPRDLYWDHFYLLFIWMAFVSWADQWQMCFIASKCEFLQITQKTKPLRHTYTVDEQIISETRKHQYLGVTINNHMDWKDHVQVITARARSALEME